MFGVANQMLAVIAWRSCPYLVNEGRARYLWVDGRADARRDDDDGTAAMPDASGQSRRSSDAAQ
jgi:hypothetical protein